MEQLDGCSEKGKDHIICRLKKSIYGLKQASRQWYLKFNDTITAFGFKENIIDRCIYLKNVLKLSGSLKKWQKIPYASVVGSLIYAQICTKPYISFAIGMLGRYQSNPGMSHWKAAKRVLRYLQGTKDYQFTFRRTDNLEVTGYSNFDFASCSDSRKSTSGYVFLLAGGGISWKSMKQTITVSLTMEAEFVACFEATVHGLWLRNFILELGVVDSIARPLRIYCDNSFAIFFSKNDRYSKGTKHMELKYLSVKEEVQK
ncbi:secreted RxLR effector protein 161-like [Carya illinoinensis]|uniref:secreted RxLR effector protein 161-like n=1 Tax=Carya illinoinensis TaxID=32201 RepID=UPI001C71EF2B|nr:secreted RxLR effector protein 161-like [Carya illinoinensis]